MPLTYAVADQLSTQALRSALVTAITGPSHAHEPAVLWEDRGGQVLMRVATLSVHLVENTLVVAIDTETAEFGRAPLIVRFQLGGPHDNAGLVAASDATALGHPEIAARWGALYRSVLWSALLRLVEHHANERGEQPHSLSLHGDHVRVLASPRTVARELALQHVRESRGTRE